jgi:outer membrane protein assembly complex protein YaeT
MRASDHGFPPVYRCASVLAGLLVAGTLACWAQGPAQPAREVVADVIVKGNVLIPTQQIMSQLKTRAGQPYSEETVRDDVRALAATKQFGDVRADLERGPEGLKVIFRIQDYPNTVKKVLFMNARHLKDDDLKQLTGIREGTPLNPVANRLACRTIANRYNEEGRPFADCELLKGDKPGDTEVVFNIFEGPKVKIQDIQFRGNTFVSGAVLATHINSSKKILGIFGGSYNKDMVNADVTKLEEYYKEFGFHDVHVSTELVYTPDGSGVILVFHIHEGDHYKIGAPPMVQGAKSYPQEQFEAMASTKVKAGQFFNQKDVEKVSTQIQNYYGYGGQEAHVRTATYYPKDQQGVCNVVYEIDEQPPVRVGNIFVVGNTRTRQNVILRQVPLYPGEILSFPDVLEAEKNLARLDIFNSPDGSVRPTVKVLDPDAPNNFRNLLVTVEEQNTGTFQIGAGVTSDAGFTGSIIVNERNFDITRFPTSFDDFLSGNAFRGAGQEFRIEAVPGTQLQRYQVSWREPFLFDSLFSLGTSAYYFDRIYNEDNETREGGRITIGRKLDQYWGASVGLRLENVAIHDVSPFAPLTYQEVVGNNFLGTVRASVARNSTDSILRPTSGSRLEFSYEQAFSDPMFPILTADYDQYFTVWQRNDGSGRHVIALRNEVAWAGDNTPVYERFYAGGFRSIRGFQFRGVGPDDRGFKVGGDFMLLNSIEYQLPIRARDDLYLVAFVDGGTVEPRIGITDYRLAAGFGLRIQLPILGRLPLALDFGFPINKAPGDNTQVFSFFIGFTR